MPMRTSIKASWIVGHEAGHHRLIRDGVVVYEGNRIIHVGKTFDGPVDSTIDATDKLVAPGFIDTHVHTGHRATHRLITDTGRPMYFGQPFLEISVPREGAVVKGAPRDLHGRRIAAQRRDDLHRIRQPGARAGRAACGSDATRHPRVSCARLRLRPLGRRRPGPPQAYPQRSARPRRTYDRARLDREE